MSGYGSSLVAVAVSGTGRCAVSSVGAPMTERQPLNVLSLGAGVQSSCLYLMAVHGDITPQPNVAIFADTGWEPKRVYEWLDMLRKVGDDTIPIQTVSRGNLREDTLRSGRENTRVANMPLFTADASGPTGMLMRQCSREYKVEPITKAIRALLGLKPRQRVPHGTVVDQWFGISIDEVTRMRVSNNAWITNQYPLVDKEMDRRACIAWMEAHGYAGAPRSACIGCPYHSNDWWRDCRDNHPDEWADAVEFDAAARHGVRGVQQDAYLHRQCVPLDQVDLSTPEERGQVNMFEDECEGMCGV